jgi:hypothetical protein
MKRTAVMGEGAGTPGPRESTSLIDIQVVTPNACGPDLDLLSVRRPLPSRYPRVSNELYHRTPSLSLN